ncbi:MAG TPA: hypothetical protein VGF55_09250 [Gemmataceae bacterium]|jgi:hypothetical protein
MLGLLLTLVLLAVGVAVLLAVGTLVIQGYLYSQPVGGIVWRSAAAGAAVCLFFAFWCWLQARSPGQYGTLLDFSPRDTKVFDKFWSERVGGGGKQEILYTRGRDARGRVEYRDPSGRLWQRSGDGGVMTAIIVEEDGEKKRFEAEMTPSGQFKIEENRPLRYVEQGGRGRVMTDNEIGEITTTRYGLLFGNLLLNLAHLVVWFLCLWLLLEFQWPHALGLAAALWVAFALLVWPVVREQVPVTPPRAERAWLPSAGFAGTVPKVTDGRLVA